MLNELIGLLAAFHVDSALVGELTGNGQHGFLLLLDILDFHRATGLQIFLGRLGRASGHVLEKLVF